MTLGCHEIPAQSMACPIQKVLSTINPPPKEILQGLNQTGKDNLDEYEASKIIGAKMIRVQRGDWSADEAAEFVETNFPCAKYIVNIRSNVYKQALSWKKIWEKTGGRSIQQIRDKVEKENDFLHRFSKKLGDDKVKLINKEAWTENITVLNEVVDWAGFRHCQYDKMLHQNKNRYEEDRSEVHLGDECHSPD